MSHCAKGLKDGDDVFNNFLNSLITLINLTSWKFEVKHCASKVTATDQGWGRPTRLGAYALSAYISDELLAIRRAKENATLEILNYIYS